MNKYIELWNYIKKNNKENYLLSFEEINNILGFNLNHSFLNEKKNLLQYGYEVKKTSLKNKTVEINKRHN